MKSAKQPVSHRYWLSIAACLLSLNVQAGLPETVERIRDRVVAVGTYLATRRPPAVFKGTGFVVQNGRHVVTNSHVVPKLLDHEKREVMAVFLRRGEKIERRQAELIARDEEHDVALLAISGKPLEPMILGNDRNVREGEIYGFTGFPIGMVLGLTPVTHRGIVSAITPVVIPAMHSSQLDVKHIRRMRNPFKVFQLDATAYPGNSGSPLYEADSGRVVGVINSVVVKSTKESALSSPTGISYAIPIRFVKKMMKKTLGNE